MGSRKKTKTIIKFGKKLTKEQKNALNSIFVLVIGTRIMLKMAKYFRDVKKNENNLL